MRYKRPMPAHAKVSKVVIPAAGLGTRFLPATKAVPKELLPIVDVPTIQYIVEEATRANIADIILINGRYKGAIEDHFDISFELETTLEKRGKHELGKQIRAISDQARIVSLRQKLPLGLGHAVLCAETVVGDQPFGVILGDDLIDSEVPAIAQLIEVYEKHGKGVVALMEVDPAETNLYGIAAGKPLADDRVLEISQIIEKPAPGTAPSNHAVIGRYVLPPSIFEILRNTRPGVGGEIQLTDALAVLARTEGLLGYRFRGERYDAGDRLGYLKANVAYALKRPDLREPLLEYLRSPHALLTGSQGELLLGVFAKRLALAYLLPSGVLLHQMAVRQSEELPPSFDLHGTVTLSGDEARRSAAELGLEQKDPLAISATLDFSPGKCSLQVQGPRPLTVVNERGQVAAAPLSWATQLARLGCLPFLFRGEQGGDSLEAALRKAGANFEDSALSREDGAVAYVVGAGEGGSGRAGLVISKRDLIPLRAWDQESGSRNEVAFGGYREVFHRGGVPTLLELRVNGALVARFSNAP